MANEYSLDNLLQFLEHAGDRGLMPVATAQALAVATRNVLGILADDEKADLSQLDLDAVIKRFTNKRARDFNPASIKEYSRRVRRAVDLFLGWREDPAHFTIKTRATGAARRKDKGIANGEFAIREAPAEQTAEETPGTYRSAFPVRPGLVVTLIDIPNDLTRAEAERLADFIKMLAVK